MFEHMTGINPLDRSVRYGESLRDIAKTNAVGKYRRAALEQWPNDRQSLQTQGRRGIEIDPAVGTGLAAAILNIDRAGLPQSPILFARQAGRARLDGERLSRRQQA